MNIKIDKVFMLILIENHDIKQINLTDKNKFFSIYKIYNIYVIINLYKHINYLFLTLSIL